MSEFLREGGYYIPAVVNEYTRYEMKKDWAKDFLVRFEKEMWAIPNPKAKEKVPMYFDRKGQPMTREEWAEAFEDGEGRRIAFTKFKNSEVFVSTMWLGLEHGYREDEEGAMWPLIFETMVFGLPDDSEPQFREATEEAALRVHDSTVAMIMAKYNLEPEEKEPEALPVPTFQITYEDE